jgi:O-antigen ligase
MRTLTFLLVCVLVVIMPWEEILFWEELTSLSRILGVATLAAGMLAILMSARLRPLPLAMLPFALFIAWSFCSLAWSMDPDLTLERSITYSLLYVFSWLIWEFADTMQLQQWLMRAHILGCILTLVGLFANYTLGIGEGGRFAAYGTNPNGMAMQLVASCAFALYLASQKHTVARFRKLYWVYMVVAALGTLLTGSRAGLMCLGLLIVVAFINARRLGWGPAFLLLVSVGAVGYIAPKILSETLVERYSEGREAHTLQVRLEFWQAGMRTWMNSPLQGCGSGSYREANIEGGGSHMVAHNSVVSVLVENGVIGLALYSMAWALPLYRILRLPRAEKALWITMLAGLLPILMSGSEEYHKLVWLVWAMLLSQTALLSQASPQIVAARALRAAAPLRFPQGG